MSERAIITFVADRDLRQIKQGMRKQSPVNLLKEKLNKRAEKYVEKCVDKHKSDVVTY